MRNAVATLCLVGCVASLAADPAPVLVVKHRWEAVSVAFSPDGKLLAAGSGHTGVMFWDATSGKEVCRIDGAGVGDLIAFSPDGKKLASAGRDTAVKVWDAASLLKGR